MDPSVNIPSIAHVIQQAVAPVFLLTGVGAILGVLTNRLGRIVDRYRVLRREVTEDAAHTEETRVLTRRARLIHWAISCCTVCALLICLVISALFLGAEMTLDPSRIIVLLFIAAMFSLIAGLLCFLREITLATGNIDIGKTPSPQLPPADK
ncbi:MAG TPA: DUF2721 domain-containing protein [Rhodocyclaceae bacterium]|jgi:hypothetical protein